MFETVQRSSHTTALDLEELRVWQSQGTAAVVSGMLDEHRFHFDALADVPVEAWRATQISVVALRCPGLPPSLGDLPTSMRAEPWPVRAATLRQVALRLPDAALAVHHDALLDPHYGVRMFAAYQLSGVLPLPFRPDVSQMIGLVDDPLAALGFSPWPDWDLARGRRNVRLALLWALGNLGWAARGGEPWLVDAWHRVQRCLERPAGEPFDALMAQLHGDASQGITGPTCSLAELLRYAVHRHRIMERLELQDRFFWFDTAVRGVCPPDSPAGSWVYAPTPEVDLATIVVPEGWVGANPYGTGED